MYNSDDKFPSEEEFESFFWEVFNSLNCKIKETLKGWWQKQNQEAYQVPYIFCDPNKMPDIEENSYAATGGVCLQFRLDRMTDKSVSIFEIIFHELGHAYYMAINEQSLNEYQKNKFIYEKQADEFAKKNVKRLKKDRKSKQKIISTCAFEKLRSLVNIYPFD